MPCPRRRRRRPAPECTLCGLSARCKGHGTSIAPTAPCRFTPPPLQCPHRTLAVARVLSPLQRHADGNVPCCSTEPESFLDAVMKTTLYTIIYSSYAAVNVRLPTAQQMSNSVSTIDSLSITAACRGTQDVNKFPLPTLTSLYSMLIPSLVAPTPPHTILPIHPVFTWHCSTNAPQTKTRPYGQ
ncbi:hypothetical protein BDV95DRAFT_588908 [Massariosphaeria phaeospora]|uniref:Uncharacterized protein n=1 Tax=Massariosphaeria phaeospora TaxID=100035 RepID=A0A7C8MGR7_9PLEO|nr:hypothetical protein BDV95DRAFT_588908 [Massariosphaeria phaeospora]